MLNSMKNEELKKLLRLLGLNVTGKCHQVLQGLLVTSEKCFRSALTEIFTLNRCFLADSFLNILSSQATT